jgi:ribose 5-phosphate isomerase A
MVQRLGAFPLPVEVIPESRSLVARKIVSMGGKPVYRSGFITDQGNQILDIENIDISNPKELEIILNNIPGVVENGIFASDKPEIVLISE